METFPSTEAKDRWGLIADTALRQPVMITKHGRPTLVVISFQDYETLQRLKYDQLRSDVKEGLADIQQKRFSAKTVETLIREGKWRLKKRRD
jgi:prevent-host-death family protein